MTLINQSGSLNKMAHYFGKCKGPGNTGMSYEMGGTILSKTVKEKFIPGYQ